MEMFCPDEIPAAGIVYRPIDPGLLPTGIMVLFKRSSPFPFLGVDGARSSSMYTAQPSRRWPPNWKNS